MKKSFAILVLIACVLVGFYFLTSAQPDASQYEASVPSIDVVESAEILDRKVLSAGVCGDSGGAWDACGSACRMNPEDICIEVCVEYCECQSDDQCPKGYTCGDYIDDVGVCL